MNKKILCFILFFIVIFITIAGCISNANNNTEDTEGKEISEIEYLDSKIMSLLNSMNNIKFENYNITIKKIDENPQSDSSETQSESSKSDEQKGEETSSDSNQDSDSQSVQSSEGSDKSSKSSKEEGNQENDSKSTSSSEESSDSKQYKLERIGILTEEKDNTDWENIKNETELLYAVIPTITLDLYKKDVSQEDILNFNKNMDTLTKTVEEENKENTLYALADLYSYLPKYSKVVCDEKKSLLLETKSNIFYAYSLLEKEDWPKVAEYLQKAIQSYSRILNNVNDDENNNSINKGYILLNELYSSVNIQDKNIFLIKYRNLLEELNTL